MRYELMRLLQLAFSLALMFGAFLGGLALGWYRWGRRPAAPGQPTRSRGEAPATELFTPDPDFPPSDATSPQHGPDGPPVAELPVADLDLRDAVRPHATFAPGALPARSGQAAFRTQEEPSR